MNTKVRCKPRTRAIQGRNFVKTILQYIKKSIFTSAKNLLKSIIPTGII